MSGTEGRVAARPRRSADDGAACRRDAGAGSALGVLVVLVFSVVVAQSLIVVQARPQDLITGIHGMADIIRRAMPPDFVEFPRVLWPALETVDIAIFGTVARRDAGAAAGGAGRAQRDAVAAALLHRARRDRA